MRIIPDIDKLLRKVDKSILAAFIPAIKVGFSLQKMTQSCYL